MEQIWRNTASKIRNVYILLSSDYLLFHFTNYSQWSVTSFEQSRLNSTTYDEEEHGQLMFDLLFNQQKAFL